MTHKEYRERLAKLAVDAANIRCALEELSNECRQEWCDAVCGETEEAIWYGRHIDVDDLVTMVSEVESRLTEPIEED